MSIKNSSKELTKEATGVVATGLKLGIVLIPVVVGINIGLPNVNRDEAVAALCVALGVYFGFKLLHKSA